MTFRQVGNRTLVAGQLLPGQMDDARRHGVTVVVNNRPDGEEPAQPLSADLALAAEAAGLGYRHVPIARGIGPAEVQAMREAIQAAGDGKLLAFCRSGTRSTLAWALAMREDGVPADELKRLAEAAGYSLAPISHLL